MKGCVFCQMVAGKAPCHRIWEDEKFMAFLSIFPNTEGLSVVIPKKYYSSYAFKLPDPILIGLVLAAQKVARLLDARLVDVGRTGLIFEGFGVDHVHAKLFPMHGTREIEKWKPLHKRRNKFFRKYEGYISSHDYQRADELRLEKIAKKIRNDP